MEKWQKFFLWWGMPRTSLLCLLTLLLGLNFLPQPLQANTLPLSCQILCWLGICKDLKALSQTLQGWTRSLSCALSPPTLIPSSNNMISLTNLPSTPRGPVASRWAPLFICSLKLILVLKMMLQMTNLILWCAYNLTRYPSCSIFYKGLAPWTTNMCLDRKFIFFFKFMPQWLHCFGKQGRVASGRWSGASGGPRNSCFWVFVYLYNVVV